MVKTKLSRALASIIAALTLVLAIPLSPDIIPEFTVGAAEIIPFVPSTDENGVYQIGTKEELFWFAGLVNGTLSDTDQAQTANAVLTADIVVNEGNVAGCNGVKDSEWVDWTPIGNTVYSGTFDGQNHTVSGLYRKDSNVYLGLFGTINNATIKNVGVINSYFHIESSFPSAGVCGNLTTGTISKCYSSATIIGTGYSNQLGGICGYNGGGTISDCYNTGDINSGSTYGVGGICGSNISTVTNCYYNKDICNVGGINRADVEGQAVGKTQTEFDNGDVCVLLGYHSYQYKECILCSELDSEAPVTSTPNTDWDFTNKNSVIYGKSNQVRTFNEGINPELPEYQQYWNWKFDPTGATPVLTLKDGCTITLPTVTSNVLKLPEGTFVNYSGTCQILSESEDFIALLGNNLVFNGTEGAKLTISSACPVFSFTTSKATFKGNGTVEITSGFNITVSTPSVVSVSDNAKLVLKLNSQFETAYIGPGCIYEKNKAITEDSSTYYLTVVRGVQYVEEPMTSWDFKTTSENIYGNNSTKVVFAQGVDPTSAEYADLWNWKFEPATQTTKPVFTLKDGFDVTLNSEWKFPADTTVNYSGSCKLYENYTFMRFVGGDVTFHGTDADSRLDVSGSGAYVMCGTYSYDVINLIIDGNGTVSFTALHPSGSAIVNITTLSVKDNATVISSCQNLNPINGGEVVSGYYTKKNAETQIGDVTYKQTIIKGNADLGDHFFDDDGFCVAENCLRGLNGESEYKPAVENNGVYEISKPGQLFWFAEKVNGGETNVNAKLLNDIVIPEGRQWIPINEYLGVFDGNGHTISGMNVEIAEGMAGMFLELNGSVKHLGIIDSSFATVGVQGGPEHMLGAVAGFFGGSGTIEDCYSRNITFIESDTLAAIVEVGGIVGIIDGSDSSAFPTIKNCYSAGLTFNEIEAANVFSNGIVALTKHYYAIENCYYEANENFNKTVSGATSKTAIELASGEIAFALNAGRTGADAVWGQKLGENGDAYPVFGGETIYSYKKYASCAADSTFETVYTNDASLDGTVVQDEHDFTDNNGFCNGCGCYEPAVLNNGVYEISNAGQLYWFADKVNNDYTNFKAANAKLVKDIVVNNITVDENYGSCTGIGTRPEWIPIGQSDTKKYMGTFDGNNKTISGLYYDEAVSSISAKYSFMNYLGETGVIKNFGLVNTFFKGVNGGTHIAGICAFNYGRIENSYFSGTIGGNINSNCWVGGVCAVNNGTITKCYTTTHTQGGSCVGGICGLNNPDGTIIDCYNTGTVKVLSYLEDITYGGGICGFNEGEIRNCYNNKSVTSAASGTPNLGGICGSNSGNGTIENCYFIYGTGIASGTPSDSVIQKTTAAFASGEVTVLLNNGGTGSAAVWGQKLTGDNADAYPVFSSYKVYSGYKHGETTATYTNDGTLKLHSDAASDTNNNHDSSLDANTLRIVGDDCHAYTCSVCGEEIEKSHDFGDGQYKATSDDAIHYIQCKECGYRRVHSADMIYAQNSKYHIGSCEHEGCNYRVAMEAHTFTRFFKGDAEKHIAVCEECGFVTAKEHNFVNGVCKDCGYEKPLDDTVAVTDIFASVTNGVNRASFIITRDIPVKYTIIEHGMIYSNNNTIKSLSDAEANLKYNNINGTDIKAGKSSSKLYSSTFRANIADIGYGVYAKPYVKVRDEAGNDLVGYGDAVYGSYEELAEKAIIEACDSSVIKVDETVNTNNTDRVSFSVMRSLKDGYTVVEHGVVYSNNGSIRGIDDASEKLVLTKIDGTSIKKGKSSTKTSYGIFKANIAELGHGVYARGYIIAKDSYGNTATIYSDVYYGKHDSN